MIKNFLSPCSAHGFRWPLGDDSTIASTRTGSVTLFTSGQYINSAGFTGTYCGANAAAKGTQCMYLFRNPLRAAVVLTTISSAATYHCVTNTGAVTFTPVYSAGGPVGFPLAYATAAVVTNAPHTQTLFGGGLASMPDVQFFWLGTGDKFDITLAGTGTPSDNVGVIKVDTPGARNAQGLAVAVVAFTTLATQSYTATEPGYYGLTYTTNSSSPTWTYAVNLVVAAGDVFSHIPVPFALEHASFFRAIRLLSSSMLVSNVASEVNVEGTIYGAVITDGTPFYTHTVPSDLTSKLDHYQGRAKKGLYTWLRPSGTGVFNYRNAITVTNNVVSDTTFMLDDGSAYQVATVFSAGINSSSYPALDFLMAFSFTLEFLTDDPWVEAEFASMTSAEATKCLEVAIRAMSFSENPLHLAQIQAFVGKAGSFLRSHSVAIGTILSALFPGQSGIINRVARYAQS